MQLVFLAQPLNIDQNKEHIENDNCVGMDMNMLEQSMKQIIAIGGGGFSEEPENPLLDLYVLGKSPRPNPKICFLPTASGDADSYLLKFYKSFSQHDCLPKHLSLFRPHTSDIEDFILNQDVVYVGGGNTRNMLVLWKEWGMDSLFKKAWDNGIILAGISAGAICWFEQGATDSIPGRITALDCLGFIKGSCCPHYDRDPLRPASVPALVKNGELKPGYALDNSVALHFIDQDMKEAVSSVQGKRAYHVSPSDFKDLSVRFLG